MSKQNVIGLVGGIQKFSTEDGPGIRTTVFLKGCPLNCKWCHNPELVEPEVQLLRCPNNCIGCGVCAKVCPKNAISFPDGAFQIDWKECDRCLKCAEVCWARALNVAGQWMTVQEVISQVLQDKDFYLHTNGGMTISGGELLSQPEFAEALLDACEENGIGVALDTSGYGNRETLLRLARHKSCTHLLFDMKLIESEEHRRFTGVGNEIILKNLEMLAADPLVNPKLIIRMPLIKGINDSEADVQKICSFFTVHNLTSVTLLPYHELGISKCRNIGGEPEVFLPSDAERIAAIQSRLEDGGVMVEVLGN